MKNMRWSIGVVVASIFTSVFVGATPQLMGGSVSGKSGATVLLPIQFDPTSSSISSMQFSLKLPKGVHFDSAQAGPILSSAGKTITTRLKNSHTLMVIIFGMNQNTVPAGQVLTAQLKIASEAAAGNLALPISGVVFTDPKGNTIKAGSTTAGTISVVPAQ